MAQTKRLKSDSAGGKSTIKNPQIKNLTSYIVNRTSLLLLALLAASFTGLGGEYPLNDDWIHSSGVLTWLDTGHPAYYRPAAPNLIGQVGWGTLCCWIGGGFSFVTLRVSTVLLAALGLVAMYQLINVATGEKRLAFAAGLLLLTNPVYYNLSFSFMTDVPFAALVLVGLWQYARYFRDGRPVHRILGALAAVAAFSIRQPGILLWVAAEGAILWRSVGTHRARLVFGAQLLGMGAVFVLFEYGIKGTWLGPDNFYRASEATILRDPGYAGVQLAKRYVMALFFVGLFTLPLLPRTVQLAIERKWYRRGWFLLLLAGNIALLAVLAGWGRIFPYSGYTIYNFGLGTPLLSDFHYWRIRSFPQLPAGVVMVGGLIVQLHSFLLLRIAGEQLIARFRARQLSDLERTVLLFGTLYTGIVFFWGFFDRYVLLPFALVLYLFWRWYPSWGRFTVAQWAIVTVLAGYAVLGTKDYLNWNGAVAQYKHEWLASTGVPRAALTAGHAQDGWDTEGRFEETQTTFFFAWGPLDGFTTLDTLSYTRWLPGPGRIYLLRRNEEANAIPPEGSEKSTIKPPS